MLAFRVADSRYPLFDGSGAAHRGARWNSAGNRVIYSSDTLAGAMLEVLAHLPRNRLPKHHAYIRIDIPEDVSRLVVDPTEIPGWSTPESGSARRYGDTWIARQMFCVLLVPSILIPESRNVLINPLHPEFPRIQASLPQDLQWDTRLFGLG
ncbi:MAG: RES domain-containing protein [Methylococcaceae bacterium]|nr:MAG: RES domain-containing protein [Methylococcaceae bacterium]